MLETVTGTNGIVTAPHRAAAEAGCAVLRDGGNAVEATVAVAATLAAVYPHMTGIGGDGFWLVREPDGIVHSVHGCGGAAARADLSYYAGHTEIPSRGPLAANTVAGTVSAWEAVLDAPYCTMPFARLLRDAIGHAENGVLVSAGGARVAAEKGGELRKQPGAYATVFEPDNGPLQQGDVLRQPALAATFRQLAHEGPDSFYRGALADAIAADLAALGSPVTAEDLAAHRAIHPDPLTVGIKGAQLYNTAPPTQGFASLLILALYDRVAAAEADGFDHVHRLVEATKQAFLLRDEHVGDPEYTRFGFQDFLDDASALDALAARINTQTALPWPQPSHPGDTCWFGAADRQGRVVSAIQSTYHEFGSGLVLPEAGITWQNRGASFKLAADGWNALRPGRKPFHTLNPALAAFDDGRVMAYGTMGGEGQPQTQATLFTRHVQYGVDLQTAITTPRWLLGRTWGEQSTSLKLEDGFEKGIYDALATAGHDVERVGPLTDLMGQAGAVVYCADGTFSGATDPRSDGEVVAW